jgi:hypothetical protein
MNPHELTNSRPGSHDGTGAGDHDETYQFGWRPRASATYPFSTRQYARLLMLRGRTHDGLLGRDDIEPTDHNWVDQPIAA